MEVIRLTRPDLTRITVHFADQVLREADLEESKSSLKFGNLEKTRGA
ncbi:MAG: hypothetical protein SH818_17720 [Saprospiraceae bacterium]|nr:hypothetical protein [Saprospiraceae bacterium]